MFMRLVFVPQTLMERVRCNESNAGSRADAARPVTQRLMELERETKDLRKANKNLKLGSAFFE